MSTALVLDLIEGCELVMNGQPWRVERLEPYWGKVVLRPAGDPGGQVRQITIAALMHHRDCRVSTRSMHEVPAAGRGRQPATWKDLSEQQRQLLELRLAHLLEAETGFRSGDPFRAGLGEPYPDYDPALVPLVTDRRRAKAAELAVLREREPEHARMLGLGKVSLRTLERWAARYRRWGVMGCADDRWLRECAGHRVPEPVREAIYAVRAACLHSSKISMASRERKIHQYVREKYGDEVVIPSSETLRLVWQEWFGPGGSRQRYARSAAVAEANATGGHVVIHRPGQVVALDTTPLPVLVRESVFSEPVEAHLSLALDCYTHSLVAFRITLVSEKSVDVACCCRDVMTPLPCAPTGAAWPGYPASPGLVAELVTTISACRSSRSRPSPPTTDRSIRTTTWSVSGDRRQHGPKSHAPHGQQACERAFRAIQSLLLSSCRVPGVTSRTGAPTPRATRS